MNRKIEILKDKESYIAFFPDIYHFFPCTEDQAQFMSRLDWEQKESHDINNTSVELFQQQMTAYIKIKEEELLTERRLKNEAEIKKNRELFAIEKPRILGRLIISPTTQCNLKCKYCYAHDAFGDTNNGSLTPEIALAALENLYKWFDAVRVIHFIGGEPLLNITIIETVCAWLTNRYEQKQLKILPVFAVITNGTLVNPLIIETLKKYKIQVVVSVDGNSRINDANRVFANEQGSYQVIYKNFQAFVNAGLEPKIQITYNQQHIKQGVRIRDLMHFFATEFHVSFLHIGLVTSDDPMHVLFPEQQKWLEENYQEAIELIFSSHRSGENLSLLQVQDIMDALINKQPLQKLCGCGGIDTVALNWNGDLYPCNFFFSKPEYAEGNLTHASFSFDNPQRKRVEENIQQVLEKQLPKCQSCWAVAFCTGCLGNFVQKTTDTHVPDAHCHLIKQMVKAVIFQLAKAGNEPTVANDSFVNN